MNDKIKQAFEECEKFIDEHTPEELREYEKSLNLDYESYYKTPKRHTDRKGEEMSEFNYLREKARMTKKAKKRIQLSLSQVKWIYGRKREALPRERRCARRS